MKINTLCFDKMLRHNTPLQIKKQVEANMHCSKVVFASDKKRLTLELKDEEHKLLSYPCVYRWLVPKDKAVSILGDESLLNKLEKKEINETPYYVLYFGKSVSGKTRILSQHLRDTIETSTLRRTLYSLLYNTDPNAIEQDIEPYFIGTYFEWLQFDKEDEKELIACIEAICVALGTYPLNIEGNPRPILIKGKSLKELRGSINKQQFKNK